MKIIGFVENLDHPLCATPIHGLPVYWIDDIAPLAETHAAICCLATPHRSVFVEQVAALGFAFATLVHPTAAISNAVEIVGGGEH